jgi:hypothetical protein
VKTKIFGTEIVRFFCQKSVKIESEKNCGILQKQFAKNSSSYLHFQLKFFGGRLKAIHISINSTHFSGERRQPE